MVFSHSYVEAGIVTGAPLADDDVAGLGKLASVDFNPEPFAVGFPSVGRTACTFFVSHICRFLGVSDVC
jgi:hypothetical protein